MSAVVAGYRLQLALVRRDLDSLLVLLANPLLALAVNLIIADADRPDLLPWAVVAPAMIGMWAISLTVAGELVSMDRQLGVLELATSAPTRLPAPTFGRVLATTSLGFVAVAQSWLVTWVATGSVVAVRDPIVFGATLALLAAGMAATALLMAAVFVLARSATIFQNSLSYPFYVLGGLSIPVSLLPFWLSPVSRLLCLSWGSELLRDALTVPSVDRALARLGALVATTVGVGVLATASLRRVETRVRRTGSAALA